MAGYTKCPENYIFGLDIGTRSIVGTVGYRENEKIFKVVAQVVKMHETRAMLDGQIHDIGKVAETICKVKEELQELIQYRLEEVCIAAAGRVLKTVNIRADYEFEVETIIDEECIHTLELFGMEQAYAQLKADKDGKIGMYCVGSTVIHYYLDDYIMLSLEGHKGKKISADFLATFLPDEVIESLYAAVEKAGLKVANLTLEPIAASEVAIPVNFRLLNIALVDVGAGTSDICITKDGSIIGYGMIPLAGDEFTEEIAKRYLVDFGTAEKIKTDCFAKKTVIYKDIMGISHKISSKEVLDGLNNTVKSITKKVAEKIKELNGGSSVSAVFIVGGGGKLPQFAESLAENLEIQKERVAVRGVEVLGGIEFLQEGIARDSTLVTPVGICLSYYSKNNNFIMVSANGRQIKLYDNNKLTVMDAAIQLGFPKENLFPKRGKELVFNINNEKRMVRGEVGEGAIIQINGKAASFNTRISENDIIEIIPSTQGKDAVCIISSLPEFKRKGNLNLIVNGKDITCPRMIRVNGVISLENYEVKAQDEIEILDYYYLPQLLELMDMPQPLEFYINQKEAEIHDRIYDGCEITCVWQQEGYTGQLELVLDDESKSEVVADIKKSNREKEQVFEQGRLEHITGGTEAKIDLKANETVRKKNTTGIHDITVLVNEQSVTLQNKENYIFVDILDFYPFDTSKVGGSMIVTTVNGLPATFTSEIQEGDRIELYWKD